MTNGPAIDAEQIVRRFGDNEAVAGVDLTIAAGPGPAAQASRP